MPTTSIEEKRKSILDAARRLLIAHGFQAVALDQVAREAGVAKGTLFLYYKSKDDLFSAALAELVESLGQSLEDLSAAPLEGRALLEATIDLILGYFERNKDFMSQIGTNRMGASRRASCGRLLPLFKRNLDLASAILRRCARSGVIRGDDCETYASFLFGLCRSSVVNRTLTGRDLGFARRARLVLDFFLSGAGR